MLKPPPETPLTAYLLADAFAAARLLPEGVLSVLPGDREVGAHLVAGDPAGGQDRVHRQHRGRAACVARLRGFRIARQTLELGGKSPAIVLDDADIEHVVRTVIPDGGMQLTGQVWGAQTRDLGAACQYREAVAAARPPRRR